MVGDSRVNRDKIQKMIGGVEKFRRHGVIDRSKVLDGIRTFSCILSRYYQLESIGHFGMTDAHSYGTSLCQQSDVVNKFPNVTAGLMNSSFVLF